MNSIYLYLLVIIPTLLGFLIGWFAGQMHMRASDTKKANLAAANRAESSQPAQPADTCQSVLRDIQQDVDAHTGKMQALEQELQPATAGQSAASNEELQKRTDEAREANAALQDSLRNKESRLSAFASSYKDVIKDVLTRLSAHRDRARDFGDSLSEFNVEDRTEETIRLLLDQVANMIDHNKRLEDQLVKTRKQVAEQEGRLEMAETEARVDTLTALPNRRAFEEELSKLQSMFERHGHPFCLVIFDVDKFKSLNDKYGHAAGDAVLKMFSRVFRSCTRGTDHVSRYGGEEFVVLLPNSDLNLAFKVSERYRKNIAAARLNFEEHRLHVTASAGVAQIAPGESGQELFVRADAALYEAKQSGRNQTCRSELAEQPQLEESTEMQPIA